ncbi:MAG: flagellar export chaperone FliS [Clostridia bacterium]|nr:flagellar export chaperone FliS [Clostridia bacterium]MBR3809443.1 flagellar export chaperone FliS [Clostridia bacterium]
MVNNPYQQYSQQYKQQSVMSMTAVEMLTALYDAAMKDFELAKIANGKNDIQGVNKNLQKVQAIFRYLRANLDFKYDISKNLDQLYEYFLNVAIQANIKKDFSQVDEVITMIKELRDTYVQADRIARTSGAGA